MPEITLESLAARLAVVEQRLASLTTVVPPVRDWRTVVGVSEDNEFTRAMYAEIEAQREAERKAAREGIEE
jgi:hypothetical protein